MNFKILALTIFTFASTRAMDKLELVCAQTEEQKSKMELEILHHARDMGEFTTRSLRLINAQAIITIGESLLRAGITRISAFTPMKSPHKNPFHDEYDLTYGLYFCKIFGEGKAAISIEELISKAQAFKTNIPEIHVMDVQRDILSCTSFILDPRLNQLQKENRRAWAFYAHSAIKCATVLLDADIATIEASTVIQDPFTFRSQYPAIFKGKERVSVVELAAEAKKYLALTLPIQNRH